jgi:hypothetical protein
MYRTLLLAVALPTVLLVAGAADGAEDAAAPTAVREVSGPTDTSDGAAPAAAPGPSADRMLLDGPSVGPSAQTGDAPAPLRDPVLRSPEGFLIAPGGNVAGSGPRWRYTIEVDPETGLDVEAVAAEVTRALTDQRSWVRTRTLEQVDDPTSARIRLLVATPDTVDRLCATVGLRTNGIFSCWNGRVAAMNSWRWEVGAPGFDDLATYRTYLINHEFGHGLGYGHVGCPGPGGLAPVMMQQSKGLGGCTPNGWPYP